MYWNVDRAKRNVPVAADRSDDAWTSAKGRVRPWQGLVNARRVSDNKIQLKLRTNEFEGEYFHYTLFVIYKTGHLMKLMCEKREG